MTVVTASIIRNSECKRWRELTNSLMLSCILDICLLLTSREDVTFAVTINATAQILGFFLQPRFSHVSVVAIVWFSLSVNLVCLLYLLVLVSQSNNT